MDNINENIAEYNLNKERKILIVFDDMIADILSNKRFQQTVTELFIRCRKQNTCLVFITQYYFAIPKKLYYKKIQIDENFNKSHLIVRQILT